MALEGYRDNNNWGRVCFQPDAAEFNGDDLLPLCWLMAPPKFRLLRPKKNVKLQRGNASRFHHSTDTTIEAEITDTGIIDTHDWGFTAMSLGGADAFVDHNTPPEYGEHTFLPGGVDGENPRPLLSMGIVNGGYDITHDKWEEHQFRNVRTITCEGIYQIADGVWVYQATRKGIYVGTALVDKPDFTPLGLPFDINGVTIERNSVAIAAISSGRFVLSSDGKAIFGGASGFGKALEPLRYTEGDTGVTADIVYDAGVDLAASFGDFVSGTGAGLSIVGAVDGAPGLFSITIPSVAYDTGELDPQSGEGEDVNTLQHVGGAGIYDLDTGSHAALVLHGPKRAGYDA